MVSTRLDALRERLGRWRQRFRGHDQLALSLWARERVVRDFGIQVFRHGITYHSDRRRRVIATREVIGTVKRHGWPRDRGSVRHFTDASRRRLEFVSANAGAAFRSLLTLTYHAPGETWDDPDRNGRVARRSKRDLNRFLSCLRRELGAYIWAREFQQRGVVHYHVLCEKEIAGERVTLVWCRAVDELSDGLALLHAAKTESIRAERGARHYLSRYLGKESQKLLPPGVSRAGRWWGRSRSMGLDLLEEIVTESWKSGEMDRRACRVVRGVRAYVSRRVGWKYRGGSFVNWGGALSADVARVMSGLRAFYAGGAA